MKHQALFSLKNKSKKKIKVASAAIFLVSLRAKSNPESAPFAEGKYANSFVKTEPFKNGHQTLA